MGAVGRGPSSAAGPSALWGAGSCGPPQARRVHRPAGGVEQAEPVGAAPDRVLPAQMAADEDVEAGTRAAPGLFGDLQRQVVTSDRVVLADHAPLFVTQDLLEVLVADGHPGRLRVAGRPTERFVVLGMKTSRR